MGVISLGTDETGSILSPSAYNGIFGLRASQNFPNVDILNGIVPLFDRRDTVGPLAKYLDDLVLAYSIMYNDSASYDAIMAPIDKTQLKVKSITNFWSNLNYSSIDYRIDAELIPLFQTALSSFKSLGINVTEQTLTSSDLDTLAPLLLTAKEQTYPCITQCYKFSMNNYFGDAVRFQSDSPYHSYDTLYNSPLYSTFWTTFLGSFGVPNVTNPSQCSAACTNYDSNKISLVNLVNSWFGDFDAIVMPTFSNIPNLIDNDPDYTITMAVLAMINGNPFLSIPAGFTKSSAENPDGLPFGIGLMGRKDRMDKMFKIAKLFESKNSFVKLPYSTPLLKSSVCNGSDKLGFNLLGLFMALIVLFKLN